MLQDKIKGMADLDLNIPFSAKRSQLIPSPWPLHYLFLSDTSQYSASFLPVSKYILGFVPRPAFSDIMHLLHLCPLVSILTLPEEFWLGQLTLSLKPGYGR